MTIDLDDFPPLTSEEIEQRANALLNEYSSEAGWQIDTPVPVERIAEGYLGYDIELTNEGLFSDPNFLGGIIFEQNLIQVNGSVEEHEGRYNFTIAHELGHHTLHRDELLSRQGTEDDHVIICRESGNKPMVEQQADRFAADSSVTNCRHSCLHIHTCSNNSWYICRCCLGCSMAELAQWFDLHSSQIIESFQPN